MPEEWQNASLIQKWGQVRSIRSQVTTALENARSDSKIGGSLQASVVLSLPEAEAKLLSDIDLPALFITSDVQIIDDNAEQLGAEIHLAEGGKCARCWKILPEVATNEDICMRCKDVIGGAK
jgi:isoleucyl-tRNA synthetase